MPMYRILRIEKKYSIISEHIIKLQEFLTIQNN